MANQNTNNATTMTTTISKINSEFRSGGVEFFGTMANGRSYPKGIFAPKSVLGELELAVGDSVETTFAATNGRDGAYLRASAVKVVEAAQATETLKTAAPAKPATSKVRKLSAEVVSVKAMRNGHEIDFGYANPAYVSEKTLAAGGFELSAIEVGAVIAGEYEIRVSSRSGDDEGAKYAHIVSVSGIEAPAAG